VLRGRLQTPNAADLVFGKPRLTGGIFIIEPQWFYLRRHNLLSREERSLVLEWEATLKQDLDEWCEEDDYWAQQPAPGLPGSPTEPDHDADEALAGPAAPHPQLTPSTVPDNEVDNDAEEDDHAD
jgi:hypothetical protein